MVVKRSTKKKIWIATGIVSVLVVVVLITGYFAVNKLFSIFTHSFYQSAILEEKKGASTQDGQEDGKTLNEGDKATGEGGKQGADGKDSSFVLTAEKLMLLESKVSFSDKLAVMSVLSKSLPAPEYSELAGMVNGGISSDEVSRAYEILKTSLSQEGKNKIKEYYVKYSYLLN